MFSPSRLLSPVFCTQQGKHYLQGKQGKHYSLSQAQPPGATTCWAVIPRLCQTLPSRHWQSSAQESRQQHLALKPVLKAAWPRCGLGEPRQPCAHSSGHRPWIFKRSSKRIFSQIHQEGLTKWKIRVFFFNYLELYFWFDYLGLCRFVTLKLFSAESNGHLHW